MHHLAVTLGLDLIGGQILAREWEMPAGLGRVNRASRKQPNRLILQYAA